MSLSHRNIVITGASKGLGREAALRLCQKGANLILVARTKGLLEETGKKIECLTGAAPLIICCDVSNEQDVERMSRIIRDKFRHIDVLINNAGIGIHKTSEEMSGEEMRKQFEVNLYGPFYCIKALLPLLRLSNSAYIINVGSLVSKVSFADNSMYAATKYGLSGFTEGLRQEMKKWNIKVGLFMPGLMNTSFQEDREGGVGAPAFLVIPPEKAALKLEKMIYGRKGTVFMYRWMLFLMKIKKLVG